MSRPEGATPIGRHLYLFKSNTNSTDCIISAHGGYLFGDIGSKVPTEIELKFYSPNTTALCANLEKFNALIAKAKPVEIVRGGKICMEYLLQKYQGRHNKEGETYDTIFNGVQASSRASVVTIRNRWDLVIGLRLSDVIAEVRHAVPTIKRFYCLFCRVNVISSTLEESMEEMFGSQLGGDLGRFLGMEPHLTVPVAYNM